MSTPGALASRPWFIPELARMHRMTYPIVAGTNGRDLRLDNRVPRFHHTSPT